MGHVLQRTFRMRRGRRRQFTALWRPAFLVASGAAMMIGASAVLAVQANDAGTAQPTSRAGAAISPTTLPVQESAAPTTQTTTAPATQPGQAPATQPGAPPATQATTVPQEQAAAATQPAKRPVVEGVLPIASVEKLQWRCIGPANMGGRITALAVYEKDPSVWWAATASGGLLKTTNNGITFEHQFDGENTVSIGDVAVAQSNPDVVWVGTGEANPRNSVSWGDGVYKSTDGGQTWQHMGLRESFQIGRIAIHPENPDIVYVGALGRLWGPNEERGLYKTTDGGQTWEKVLYIDEKTGVVDVQMPPQNPEILLVAAYERQRDGFDSNDPAKKWGPGSGLYKTTDGGQTWKKLTESLPTCNLGRIGIAWYRQDPNIVYAVVESEKIGLPPPNAAYMGMRGEDVEVGAKLTEVTKDGPAAKAELQEDDIVVSVEDVTIHSYEDLVKEIRKRQAGETVKVEVSRSRESVFAEVTLAERPESEEQDEGRRRRRSPYSAGLGGQRANMHDQQGTAGHEFGGIYKSTDGGETWTRINSVNPRPMYYSQIRVDPSDSNHVWVLGIRLWKSENGGKKFGSDGAGGEVHVDHHAMWIDPRDGRHIILGNDGGVYVTYDRGEHWDHLNHAAIGQFYHVAVGPRRNYRVYGGLQDNGSWGGPSHVRDGGGPLNADWRFIGGGDGFVCRVDPDDPDLVYSEMQNGGIRRYNFRTGESDYIRPRGQRGQRYRFNWKTPFILSNHNSKIFYSAGNYVFRSVSQGDSLKRISAEITRTQKGSATALAESHHDPDVLYVGTDDGMLWATQDGGREWSKLVPFEQEPPEKEEGDKAAAAAATQPATRPATQPASQPVTQPTTQPATRPDTRPAAQPASPPTTQPDEEAGRAPPRRRRPSRARRSDRAGAPVEQRQARSADARVTPAGDAVSGKWSARMVDQDMAAGRSEFTLTLKLAPDNKVTGQFHSMMGEGDISDGRFIPKTQRLTFGYDTGRGMVFDFTATISGDRMRGEGDSGAFTFAFEATRSATAVTTGAEERQRRAAREKPKGKPLGELIPGPRRISSIEASHFEDGRVYITLDGHRSDDDEPYVFASEDYGETWRSLRANLPTEVGSTRVIREDIENPDLLYLGTEFGLYASIDRGESWTRLNNNLPTVAVHEVAIHPTAGEIVAATHGRSLWVLDVTPLRQMTAAARDAKAYLYQPSTVIHWRSLPSRGGHGIRSYTGENATDGVRIFYSLREKPGRLSLRVKDLYGETVHEFEPENSPGLHEVSWNLRREPEEGARGRRARRGRLLPAGTYLVELAVDKQVLRQELRVETDPDYPNYQPWAMEQTEAELEESEYEDVETPGTAEVIDL